MNMQRRTPPPPAKEGSSRVRGKQTEAQRRDTAKSYSGDTGDGGMMILDPSGTLIADVPPAIAHGTRDLVAKVHASSSGNIPASIGVTSALSGEGVSFVANALGAVLAHDLNSPVCIVDLNWWSPSSARPQVDKGLADLLRGACGLRAAIAPTVDDRLCVLPAGFATVSERPMLASSPDLGKVFADLREEFAYLVLDLPAVLPVSESRVLIDHADAYVMVVRHGATADTQTSAAMAEIDHVKNLGVVLNRASGRLPARLLRLINPW